MITFGRGVKVVVDSDTAVAEVVAPRAGAAPLDFENCPACGHARHLHVCAVRLPWLRRILSRLTYCCCTYWDARWGNKATVGP